LSDCTSTQTAEGPAKHLQENKGGCQVQVQATV